MSVPMTRRLALAGAVATAGVAAAAKEPARRPDAQARLAELEARSGGRLGVAMLDVASGRRVEHRAGERFALCSTFKLLAAAAVLSRVDRNEDRLDRRIAFSTADLVAYSPATKDSAGTAGMTLAELCEAAVTLSDNTAGNLLLQSLGGPAGLTVYLRALGDEVSRLDRMETALNEATPGDLRDTTTPSAMLENLRKLVLGHALSPPSRARLTEWLLANRTGDTRLRAGTPAGWRVGDKTGAGSNGANNDVAVFWRPDGSPMIVAVYYAESTAPMDQRNAVIAAVARIVTA